MSDMYDIFWCEFYASIGELNDTCTIQSWANRIKQNLSKLSYPALSYAVSDKDNIRSFWSSDVLEAIQLELAARDMIGDNQ